VQPFQGWRRISDCFSGFHPELFVFNPFGIFLLENPVKVIFSGGRDQPISTFINLYQLLSTL
ncbi:MAG TPA: hypothetical protein PK228_13970, partial [Saprospiraceae bacterium]|nr:hypothetical protein [Saprospiraceae bacterium]